ncbi:hypothetical protein [Marixanthomonas spongiae]|uniref:Sugar transporter n=1 Tax=Marixanthomonas spongiae TaxID=2174845 RepID=A0A2U0HY78_9FLAO|nr:hypothetical protein [Marixanthomonas spongiae]PVW13797.1 hypothetical protein DDV96_11610 [Marixanthomonas spongiae]
MTTTTKPNTAFWIIAVIALIWNLMGTFNFLASNFMEDMLSEAYSEEELMLLESLPSWYAIVFGVAVFSGLLGCFLLLLRKKAAIGLFFISLLAVLLQMGYWIFATDVMDVMGPQAIIMPLVVIAICIFLYFYSKGAKQRGWLN